jgi:hypothetical protein
LQGISKFETLNVKVVSPSESVNKGDVYKTNLNNSIYADYYYTINDITTPNLKFRTGQIYIFNQDDSSNDGHPITFYTDRAKNTEYTNTDNIKYIINDTEYDNSSDYSNINNFGTNRYRRVKILITDDMPGRLYYQCINHPNMGGVIETGTATSSGGSTLTVQDEGSDLSTAATTLNFVGSGVTASGTDATKTITINNELTNWSEDANGHIIPELNATYDIGSAEKKVRHLYLSQNSLYMGSGTDTNAGTPISLDADGDLKVGESKLVKGDANGNLPSSKLPANVQTVEAGATNGVLSTLTIGGTPYTLPSGGGDGGGTSVEANPTLSGSEANLTSLTVGSTNYKISTPISSLDHVVDVPFLGGIPTNKVSITYEDLSHSDAGYGYTVGGLYDNYLFKSGSPNGSYYVQSSWNSSQTWDWEITMNEAKTVKYVRIWPFQPGSTTTGKVWRLHGSNDGGTTSTLLGSHTITTYPTEPSFSTDTLAYGNEQLSVRLGFEDNHTSYTTYKLEVTAYNVIGGRFALREIQLGEQTSLFLSNIEDVSTTAPTDGQALVYDSENSQWQPGNVAASVEAHTDTQTGNEDYLSALTVEGTKYKIGTNVQQVSYSDTSKLLLSYPFSAAANATDAQTNYGSLVLESSTFSTSGVTFTQNIGFSTDSSSSDKPINLELANSYSDKSTFHCRFRKHGPTTVYPQHLLSVLDADGSDRLKVYIENGILYVLADSGSNTYGIFLENITYNRWYNIFVIVDNTSKIVKFYLNHTNENDFDERSLNFAASEILEIESIVLCDVNSYQPYIDPSLHFDGDLSDFYLFNSALSINEAKIWMDYVENGHTNPAAAPLKYLADVSETAPTDGQALVYDETEGEWKPGTVATSGGASTLDDLTDVSVSATPSDGQALVYDTSLSQWKPSNLITAVDTPADIVSYANQASSSNWSIITGSFDSGVPQSWESHHGGLYDNDTTNGSSSYTNRIFFVPPSSASISSSNFVEIEYTPTEPKIITRLLLWGRSSGSTGSFPKTVYIYGKNGTTYTELGTQTNGTAVVPGDTPTDNLAHIDFSFNSSKTFYEAYKLKITETVASSTSVIIGELNFRGYTRATTFASLSDIGNVSTTAPSDGQALVYDTSSSQWQPGSSINVDEYKINDTPLITQIHGFHQITTNTISGDWLTHAVTLDAAGSHNPIIGMKAVVDMKPYALSFGSDDDDEESTNFVFHVREADSDTTDNVLTLSTTNSDKNQISTTNRGTAYINNVLDNKSDYYVIQDAGTIRAGRNFGVYVNSVYPNTYASEFIVKVYFTQV